MTDISVLTNTQLTLLVLFSIVACMISIYIVFYFGRQLEMSALIRENLVETVYEKEYYEDIDKLRSKGAYDGPLDSARNPVPQGYNRFKEFWYPDYYPKSTSQLSPQQEEEFLEWERKEKEIFNEKCEEIKETAMESAERQVPTTMDTSLLGGGFSFLLEFSTVIVIIFTVLILGILGIFEGNEVTPILASIAGYVLGKATSKGKETTIRQAQQ